MPESVAKVRVESLERGVPDYYPGAYLVPDDPYTIGVRNVKTGEYAALTEEFVAAAKAAGQGIFAQVRLRFDNDRTETVFPGGK